MSDHAPAGCQALLQHRLIQANQKTQLGSGSTAETARTYPLSLLEWTANRKKANMVLHVHCFDGEMHLAFINHAVLSHVFYIYALDFSLTYIQFNLSIYFQMSKTKDLLNTI